MCKLYLNAEVPEWDLYLKGVVSNWKYSISDDGRRRFTKDINFWPLQLRHLALKFSCWRCGYCTRAVWTMTSAFFSFITWRWVGGYPFNSTGHSTSLQCHGRVHRNQIPNSYFCVLKTQILGTWRWRSWDPGGAGYYARCLVAVGVSQLKQMGLWTNGMPALGSYRPTFCCQGRWMNNDVEGRNQVPLH